MREIKFRAWDKRKKKMLYAKDVEDMDGLFIYFDGSVGSIDFDCPDAGIGSSDVELNQFTGLKDKNGKEIYEGDILGLENLKWQVRWIQEGEGIENGYIWGHAPNYTGFHLPFDLKNWEIIGNIYENPELLNKE